MKPVAAIAALLWLLPPAAPAHEGEDHDAPPPPVSQPVAPRASAASDEFEVVTVLDGGRLYFYLDRAAGNEPVAGARVEIDGSAKGIARESVPGVYVLDAALLSSARHPLTIAIEAGAAADLLSATLEIAPPAPAAARPWWRRWLGREKSASAATAAAGAAPAAAGPQRLADGSLFVPKPAQRQLELRTALARSGDLAATIELNGTVISDPGTGGRVQAPFASSVLPGPAGMPVAGRKVVRGEILAWLRPVASAIERGNQQAQLAEIEAQFAIADGRVKRFEQLEGAVPQKEIETARIERAALQKRRVFVAASIDSATALRAPTNGVISASHHLVAGQIVDAREILFEIVDPARLAVEALAYDPGLAASIAGAGALTEGRDALELEFVGGGRQLRGQALPLLFRIVTPSPPVAVGQPVKVLARSGHGIKGMAVPRQALMKLDAGEAAVWVHAEAERFVARKVRVRPLDTGSVAIIDGLHEGERVVTAGAGLLSQVR